MTDDEVRQWIEQRHGLAAVDRLARLATLVLQESGRQNLIAPSTLPLIWQRHILDSVQLCEFAPADAVSWIDIGTGAGFPGLATGAIFDGTTVLIEPRARRAAFLSEAVADLGIGDRVSVIQSRSETATPAPARIVSARAVASIDQILAMSAHLRTPATTYILPRGRTGLDELASASARWHGVFHVEQSLTDPDSTIVIARGVAR